MKRRRSFSGRPGSSKRRFGVKSRTRWSRRPAYRSRRRFGSKRTRMNARSSRVIKSLNLRGVGMPQALITEMPYRIAGQLSGNAQKFIALNAIFRPEGSAGHQPRFFDQFMNSTWYSRYTVYRADVEVRFRNQLIDDATVAVNADTAATWPEGLTPATLFQMGELPYVHTKVLTDSSDGGGGHTWSFKASYRPHKLLGITKSKLYGEDDYSGGTTSNPTELCYFMIGAADDPQDNTTVLIDYEIYVKYYVKLWSNKHDVPPSVSA